MWSVLNNQLLVQFKMFIVTHTKLEGPQKQSVGGREMFDLYSQSRVDWGRGSLGTRLFTISLLSWWFLVSLKKGEKLSTNTKKSAYKLKKNIPLFFFMILFEIPFFPGRYVCSSNIYQFPGAFFWLPNRYRFSRSTFFGYRTDTDFPRSLFQIS